jgi:hypothetical protein
MPAFAGVRFCPLECHEALVVPLSVLVDAVQDESISSRREFISIILGMSLHTSTLECRVDK